MKRVKEELTTGIEFCNSVLKAINDTTNFMRKNNQKHKFGLGLVGSSGPAAGAAGSDQELRDDHVVAGGGEGLEHVVGAADRAIAPSLTPPEPPPLPPNPYGSTSRKERKVRGGEDVDVR